MFIFELDILFQMTRPALTPEGGTLRNIIFLFIEESSSVRTTLAEKKAKLFNLLLNIDKQYLSSSELDEKTGLLKWESAIEV